MKRLRDDVFMNPQFKRPFGSSSRGESYGLPNPLIGGGDGAGGGAGGGGATAAAAASSVVVGGGGGNGNSTAVTAGGAQKLTTNDALTYLKEVKDLFQDQREKYDRFLDVMKDFKAQRVDTTGVIARVKELFKGHPNLILGFNTFLPKGYEITVTDEEEVPTKRTVEFEEAISFVNKIKKRFQNDDRVYKSFLDILNMYRKEHKGIKEVYQEVATLFEDHADLLDEFTRFLPDTSSTVPDPQASIGRHSFHRYDERNSAIPAIRQSHQPSRRDRIIGHHGEIDLSIERLEANDDKSVTRLHKELKKHTHKENRDRKNCDPDERDNDIENNGDATVHRFSEKRKSARKDFGDVKDAPKSMYSHEFNFCEKVKERLCSADDYQAFLKCLHIYSTEIITRKELQSLVADLLGKFPDLMEGFNEFLEHCERLEGFLAGVMGKKTLWKEGNSSKAMKIEEKDKEPKHEVEGGKEKDRYNLKYWGKSIQELDLSNCQHCSPSYRLLPEDYPIPSASQRSELGDQVLNDHWVSVTSGSEDYSFKHMRRNQYEESLFRCEDDRFELDMLLESISSTTKRAEELLNSINNNSIGSDSHIRIEDHFTALNLRCIERLYGDHGLDVMDIMRKNPSLALPVFLTRLNQKQEEWTKCRSDFNKVWADIYSKNHYKSLDHRSFYFKQQDSKNLSTKALVAEINEIKEKRQKEDNALLSIAAGNRHSIIPDLEFEYSDAEIHDDIYKIIQYSCEEVCSTKEQIDKVLKFWTAFFEPMLGIHSRKHYSVATEDDAASKYQMIKNTITGIIEGGDCHHAGATTTSLKQVKPNHDGDSSTSLQQNPSRVSLKTLDYLAKEGPTEPSAKRLTNSDVAVSSGSEANHGFVANLSRLSNGQFEENNLAKPTTRDLHFLEVGDTMKLNNLKNSDFAEGSKLTGCKDDSVGPSKNDKEEGELSPNGDFEDNCGAYQDDTPLALSMKNRGSDGLQYETGSHEQNCADAAGENDADGDDEDSENISQAGEDVSGSESAADGCSCEDHEHEEEEEAEHDLEGKSESEGEADNTSEAHDTGVDGASALQSECFLMTCKPLSKHVASPLIGDGKKDRQFFYGNDTFYVLFRLHQILYERILSAKMNLVSGESKWRATKVENSDPYARFMSSLFSLLDGSSDNTKFEDDCRSLIGNQSYVLFTLDKLIYKLVKQLQTVSSDELDCKLVQLYEYENSRKPEKYVDSVYCENVHVLFHDENIFRFQCTTAPTCLSIQLMDDGNEKSEAIAVSVDFSSYLHKDYLSIDHGKMLSSPVMLKRNMQMYANLDESTALCMATENVLIMNGLECKMAAATLKVSYVLDTEDSFIRLGWKRKNRLARLHNGQARVQRFNRFLAAFL